MTARVTILTFLGAASVTLVAACGGSGGGGTCSNGVLDPSETDVDCGGYCGLCEAGKRCDEPAECASLDCVAGICASNAASCTDGRTNGGETDVDCGGGTCPGCSAQRACDVPGDCVSEQCEGGVCQMPATCGDAQLSPGESDVDCGGPCLPCGTGKSCREHGECLSATCVFGVCKEPACDDGVRNQGETSTDCGGPCAPCQLGQNCAAPTDCVTAACEGGTCCEANACGFCGTSPTDLCDGQDNDCDGVTDGADEIGAPPLCTVQAGVCAGAPTRCVGADGWACGAAEYDAHDARYEAQELSCDGADNDCDGQTDEGEHMPNQPMCAKQQGVCAGAAAPCRGDQGNTCIEADYAGHNAAYEAAETLCDRLDNDCDGQTDEGLRNQCGDCAAEPIEQCDAVDNDCDGQTDEAPGCAACSATPVAITDTTLRKQTKSSEWAGDAFRLADGRLCGYFRAYGDEGDGVYDNRAIFFCMQGATANVFHRLQQARTGTDHSRKVQWAGPLGNDIVYLVQDAHTVGDWSYTNELFRLTTGGSVQNLSGSFPNLGNEHVQVAASSGDKVFVLSYPAGVGSSAGMTLTTFTSAGGATSQTIAATDLHEAAIGVGSGPGATPTVLYRQGDYQAFDSKWRVWRGGSFVTSLDAQYAFNYPSLAVDAAGALHMVDDPDEVTYARFAGGQWKSWELVASLQVNVYYPQVHLQPNGTPWVVAFMNDPTDVFAVYAVDDDQSDLLVSRRAFTGRADEPTGVIVDDEPRLHVFFSDERGFWNNDVTPAVAATWGYYMQVCPGISD